MKDNPQDRAGWLRLANAWKVLGENANAVDAYAKADALGPVDARLLADWAEAHVRQLAPGAPPSPAAVAVLERLEKAEPRNALALFYLGAASFAAGDKPAAAQRWKTLLALLPRRRADPRRCCSSASRTPSRRAEGRRAGRSQKNLVLFRPGMIAVLIGHTAAHSTRGCMICRFLAFNGD